MPSKFGKAIIISTADKTEVFCTAEQFQVIQKASVDAINYAIEDGYTALNGDKVTFDKGPRAVFKGLPFLSFGEKAKVLAEAGIKFTLE